MGNGDFFNASQKSIKLIIYWLERNNYGLLRLKEGTKDNNFIYGSLFIGRSAKSPNFCT